MEKGDVEEQPQKKYCCGLSKGGYIGMVVSIVVVALVAFGLIGYFVFGVGLAQTTVDVTGVNVSEMQVQSIPTDPDDKVMQVRMIGNIDNRSPFETLMKEAVMHTAYNGEAFGQFVFPEMTLVTGDYTPYDFVADMEVTNQAVFDEWAAMMMNEPVVTTTMMGEVDAKAMGIPFNGLDMEKDLDLKGVNGFRDPHLEILSQQVLSGTKDSVDMTMTVKMTNMATMTLLDLGRMKMNVLADDKVLGVAETASDSNPLLSGPNIIVFNAKLTRTKDNEAAFAKILGGIASNLPVLLQMEGRDDSTDYPMLKNAMKSMKTEVIVNAMEVIDVPHIYGHGPPYTGDMGGISENNWNYYIQSHNVSTQKNYVLQAVFQSIEGVDTLTTKDENCGSKSRPGPYIDIVTLNYNPMNVTMKIMGVNLTVWFPGDDDPKFKPFLMAETSPVMLNEGSDEPLMVLHPMSKGFMGTRLCLKNGAQTSIWLGTYVHHLFPLDPPFSFGTDLDVFGQLHIVVDEFEAMVDFRQMVWTVSELVKMI